MVNDKSFVALVENAVKKYWDLPAYSDYDGTTFKYSDMAVCIEKLHILFESSGIRQGDKIALVGRNSSHWAISLFAVVTYGAVAVPLLQDFKPDNIHHLVNHSDSKALLVASGNWEMLNEEKMPALSLIVQIDKFSIIKADSTAQSSWDHIDDLFMLKFGSKFGQDEVHYYDDQPEELALINYTSGTSGFSKGVMVPYRALWSNTVFAHSRLPFIHPGDNIVCMLPMAHMYGLTFDVFNSLNNGCHVHFLSRIPVPRIIAEAFTRIKPALILTVPLVIEKIIKNKVFPELNKPWLKILLKLPLVDRTLLNRIRERLDESFGGKCFELVIGGAAINPEVESFLQAIHFHYTVGYGMTECCPLVTYSQWDEYRQGSVGRVVDRMEIKIDSEDPQNKVGEILVRGDNVMLGYYKNPEASKAVMNEDGWMRTGDLGTIDADGSLFIRGRSKNLILGPNGQNIYPEELEEHLNNMNYVSESIVISQEGKLVALIYPDFEQLDKEHIDHTTIDHLMQANIDELNKSFPYYCKVSSFRLYQEEFEKTPKHSIRRYLYQPTE